MLAVGRLNCWVVEKVAVGLLYVQWFNRWKEEMFWVTWWRSWE
jgi:hypothetical protein